MRFRASRRPRSEERATIPIPERVTLAEGDLDGFDSTVADLREEVKASAHSLGVEMQQVRDQLVWTNRILIGLLVTIAGAATVGAYNLLITPS